MNINEIDIKKGSIILSSLLLVMALLATLITGCGNDDQADNQSLETSPSIPVNTEKIYNATFQEDFGFRGKQGSLEEAGSSMGARVPLPAYLPEDYAVQEIYVGVGK